MTTAHPALSAAAFPEENTVSADAADAGTSAEEKQRGTPWAHAVEYDVQRQLLSHPELNFSSLVVRRIQNGVCLEGVLEMCGPEVPDVSRLAREVAGVQEVLNHLLIQESKSVPPKG